MSNVNQDFWEMVEKVARAAEPLIGVLSISHVKMDRRPVTIFIVPSGEASQKIREILDEEYPNGPSYTELDITRN
jgi:hypothetical protein